MSEETVNAKGANDNLSENLGFRTALLINVPNYQDNGLKEVTEGIENLKMSSSDFFVTPTITPRQSDTYKNCISSDLLKRLEESSPIKSQKSDFFQRKPSDVCLLNCDKEDNEILISPITNELKLIKKNPQQKEEELKENDKMGEHIKSNPDLNENVISNMSTNFRTRNFKLKTQVLNKVEINEEENQENFDNPKRGNIQQSNFQEEPQSFFSNTMNFGNFGQNMNPQTTYYSPPYTTKQAKHSRKESPILSYYDGTTEYISQALFFDEFKKTNNDKGMSKNNFIKKVEEVPVPEEDSISSQSIHSLQSGKSSNNYHSSKYTDDQSSFNSFQLPFNFFNNNGSSNPNFININNLNQNFNQQSNPFSNNQVNKNEYNDSSMNSSNNDHWNMMNMNMSMMNGQMNYTPVKRNNIKNVTAPNHQTQMHYQMEGADEFSVEMFGRKGWICEMCNNFNYETRQKCNRCGINKSPKRIKKHSQTLKMNPESMKMNNNNNSNIQECDDSDELDDSEEKRKKKPFVERVGDWVCIKCKNLNFSFRVVCNRCQLPKSESDKMFEHYMSNLMNYVKFNEVMQQNILMGQSSMPGQSMPGQSMAGQPMPSQNQTHNFTPQNSGYVNNNSININNNFFNGYNQNKSNPNLGGYGKVSYTSNSNLNNGVSLNASSSMSMSNVSNSGMSQMSNMGNQFQIGNVGEDEYYDDEN